jgi:hypothetical protein
VKQIASGLLAMLLSVLLAITAFADGLVVDANEWGKDFAFKYDYVLSEPAGLTRKNEPIEITLSVPDVDDSLWVDEIRVVKLDADTAGVVVPHQVIGRTTARVKSDDTEKSPAPAQSVNIVFLADCPANGKKTYRLFWGTPAGAAVRREHPKAFESKGLQLQGSAPGLTVSNEYYTVQLDPKSGAILTCHLAEHTNDRSMKFRTRPIHFGVDVWSPPLKWDHDYDWEGPPNQKMESGPLVTRYHRWGPLQSYQDVTVSVTYTFYAHVPYVFVSSTLLFTMDRSVRAVRMGEIVVDHTHMEGPNEKDAKENVHNVFTHYAWPERDGATHAVEIDAHRDETGAENLPGVVSGAIAILDRDVAWVAGYNAAEKFGMGTLRRSQFAGNVSGGTTPQSVPCTYVANYGWGFTYWSRPIVYPLGEKGSPEDQNTAVAAGTVFGIEEALLFFTPDEELKAVSEAQRRFVEPLRLVFKGTGPW